MLLVSYFTLSFVCLTNQSEELRVAQVRAIFSLKDEDRQRLFGDDHAASVAKHFAYVEWFTRFSAAPGPHHRLYRVQKSYVTNNGVTFRLAEIIPVQRILCSVQLFPRFGPHSVVESTWTAENVLEKCDVFYVNPFTSESTYSL